MWFYHPAVVLVFWWTWPHHEHKRSEFVCNYGEFKCIHVFINPWLGLRGAFISIPLHLSSCALYSVIKQFVSQTLSGLGFVWCNVGLCSLMELSQEKSESHTLSVVQEHSDFASEPKPVCLNRCIFMQATKNHRNFSCEANHCHLLDTLCTWHVHRSQDLHDCMQVSIWKCDLNSN